MNALPLDQNLDAAELIGGAKYFCRRGAERQKHPPEALRLSTADTGRANFHRVIDEPPLMPVTRLHLCARSVDICLLRVSRVVEPSGGDVHYYPERRHLLALRQVTQRGPLGDISYPSNPNVILGRALATFVTRVEYPTRLD